jgi:hypothetical protein
MSPRFGQKRQKFRSAMTDRTQKTEPGVAAA